MNERKQKLVSLWENSLDKKIEKKLSFSQFGKWCECPHLHFLLSISKKMPWPDNDYTAYGSPLHETMEKMMLELHLDEVQDDEANYAYFLKRYEDNIQDILDEGDIDEEELSYEKVIKFASAAKEHISNVYKFLEGTFGQFTVVSVEEEFDVPLEIETEYYTFRFRGMMDLVIRTEDGVYHIIDWKTSSDGWSDWKKKNSVFLKQLLFYKIFFSRIHDIPFSKIQSHFVILESTSQKIDHLTVETTEDDVAPLLKKLRTMIYNAFEKRRFPKTGMCGLTCECKNYYQSLTESK